MKINSFVPMRNFACTMAISNTSSLICFIRDSNTQVSFVNCIFSKFHCCHEISLLSLLSYFFIIYHNIHGHNQNFSFILCLFVRGQKVVAAASLNMDPKVSEMANLMAAGQTPSPEDIR